MNYNSKLIKIGNNQINTSHLIVIGILCLAFTTSFMLRIIPAEFGWELHEFDPYFNFRATEYIVENGIEEYFEWNDNLSWYPYGRDVSSNSQVVLHISAAITYWIFGFNTNLYDFTILFPVIFGSLTSIAIFALVRVISGTTTGLLASILFSISLPILIRGEIGWFKSEPFGLFLGIISTYLFLSAIKSKNRKVSFTKIFFAGIISILGLSAWGGNQFFFIPIGIMILLLPFTRNDDRKLITLLPFFTFSVIISSLMFDRPGLGFILGLGGISIIFPTMVLSCLIFIKSRSDSHLKIRNMLIFLVIILLLGSTIILFNDSLNIVSFPTHRYLNAIYPLLTTTDPLTDSVSEHATLNIAQSFQFHSILLIFSSIGIWLILKNSKKIKYLSNDMLIFTLAIGFFGVYIGSAFMRLEVFASIGLIILSSIGLSIMIKSLIKNKENRSNSKIFNYVFLSGIIFLLAIPLFLPVSSNVITIGYNSPPTILNGGTNYIIATNDWKESLQWINENTPENSVIASWWDYGYWIQTLGNRASLADNSTLIDHRIKTIASIFFQSPSEAWNSFNELESDYFILFVSGERTNLQNSMGESFYILGGGGDESKKFWIAKIADVQISNYIHDDMFSGTDIFWENTLFGKSIPYDLVGYVNFETDQISEEYLRGWTGVYHYKNKFNEINSPFELVFSSPSVSAEKAGPVIGVFVYKINPDYIPLN